MVKKIIVLCAFTIMLFGCGGQTAPKASSHAASSVSTTGLDNADTTSASSKNTSANSGSEQNISKTTDETPSFINPSGKTLIKRILAPEGYKRIKAKKGSLTSFLRNYNLKPDGSPVLLYNGNEKGNQSAHIAVFKLPIENEDLQQCADSIMRVYGEYYYKNKAYNKITFPLGTGFVANFNKWRKGYTISINGNSISWVASSKNNSSYDSFKRFMRIVFAYSGTLNMDNASKKIKLFEAKVGDIFIRGGSPGHVVMIADICKNLEGKKAYLLAQGYMPAQEFQVLKNPLHEENPWYYEDEIKYPLRTPEYSFAEGSLRRYR